MVIILFKKFFVIFFSVLILSFTVPLTASADNTTSTTINLWSSSMWSKLETDENFVEYCDTIKDLDVLEKLNEKDFICFLGAVGTNYPFFASDTPIVDFYQDNKGFMLRFDNLKQYYDFRQFKYLYTETTPTYSLGSNLLYYSDYSSLFDLNRVFIVNDLNVYNQIVNHAQSNGFATDNIYYCADPVKSFRDYVMDYNFYDIKLEDGYKNLIKFYNYFDSPKGKYDTEYYEDKLENFVNSGLNYDGDMYYVSDKAESNNNDDHYEHNEFYKFYLVLNDEQQEYLNDTSLPHVSDIFSNNDLSQAYIKNYLNNHCKAVHFEEGYLDDVYKWYVDYVNDYLPKAYKNQGFNLVSWKDVEASTDDKQTINTTDSKKTIYAISFPMPNIYSWVPDQVQTNPDYDDYFFTGYHTKHTATEINLKNGDIKHNSGFGSDINDAEGKIHPSRDDLIKNGWNDGYPNTKGDYPYKITLNCNGEPYLYVYFDSKPYVTSDYKNEKCIKYGVNMYGRKGYYYDPVANCSLEFDFTNLSTEISEDFKNKNYWDIAGTQIRDPIDAIKDFLGSSAQSTTANFLGIDLSDFNNTLTSYFWTNYTGILSTGNYKGYYVQFNWQLEGSDHFQKNNSDDDYNYDNDYKQDEPTKDNNGNTHGGAVEKPTENSTSSGFGTGDFDFNDNTLFAYANQFLSFAAKCFAILPSWIWLLIASSIVIIIVLRVLGR